MDHRGSLRREAYAKLAALSTREPVDQDGGNIQHLVSALPSQTPTSTGYLDGVLRSVAPTSRKRMNVRELDILLALCAAAAKLEDREHAERAVRQLGDYLPEAHTQLFIPSPYLQDIKPSPWAVTTHDLTHALLSLGTKFPELKSHVQGNVKSYVSNWSQAASTLASTITSEEDEESNEQEAVEIAAISVSLVGFLEAAAHHANFWTAYERLELIKSVRTAMSEQYLIALEKAVSTVRHTDWDEPIARGWKKSLKHYAARGIPLGAMQLQQSFMSLVVACSAQFVAKDLQSRSVDLLDSYGKGSHLEKFHNDDDVDDDMIEYVVDLVTDQMNVLEEGSDYLQLSSAWQKRVAFQVKAHALETFIHCMVLDEELAEPEVLLGWCEDAVESQPQMSDPILAKVVLQGMAVLARYMPDGASNVARTLLRFVVQGTTRSEAITTAAQSLAHILRTVSTDAVITTLYSLGNVLSSQSGAEKQHQSFSPTGMNGHHESLSSGPRGPTGSVISLSMSGDEETSTICGNVARAIVTVATTCNDHKIVALAQTLLAQKISRINIIVDARIIEYTAVLAVHGKENELKSLLRLYSRMHSEAVHLNNNIVSEAVQAAREYLAAHVDTNSSLFRVLAVQLLERILSKGDVVEGEFKHSAEVEQAAQEIAPLLKPLAILASRKPIAGEDSGEDRTEIEALAREAWFNIAVHGITLQSRIGQQYYHELRLLAMHSAPIVDKDRTELLESDVELNTVLRRGMSSQHVAEQKRNLLSVIPHQESHIRHLSYQKVVYLNAVYLVESLRAASGSCAEILTYFSDPTLRESDIGACLSAIAMQVVKSYIQKACSAKDDDYAAPYIARQLVKIFSVCCHRSAKMQDVARAIADYIISFVPSSLIQKSSIFALLELLSIMWTSCLESEIDEYEWRPTFSSARGKVTIDLSDDYTFRRRTLEVLHASARRWMTSVIAIAPLDVKGLLQTYLSEYDDTGAYGHISLGRSFALEIGSMIPAMDQRLAAIGQQAKTTNVNVASDFMAQYTTRQEYRFGGITTNDAYERSSSQSELQGKLVDGVKTSGDIVDEAQKTLADIEHKTSLQSKVPLHDLQGVLRRAAALLCRSKTPQTAIVHYLVNIPFEVFTKESIKMGISLWLGVIHENVRMEPRILTEIAQARETTIDRGIGIFSPSFHNLDPFFVKEEFAPSDRELLLKQAQAAQTIISPHLRLLQFFESHFNAIRLGSPHTQRTFVRMIMRTLEGFQQARSHPLMGEIHFHAILLGLKILQFSTCLNKNTTWRLKDRLLSTALAWFRNPPMWSFGGNRLQVKAEVKVMQDVLSSLASTKALGIAGPAGKRNNDSKLSLLEALLYSEIGRLSVWLHPLGAVGWSDASTSANIASYARIAWTEDPSLAVQLVTRFPSDQLNRDVRFLLCNFPDRALHEPNAIDILLGDSLPQDLSFQLKYLLIWSPVNPCQATTYFLPGYGNHPFLLQYGVRALDSHSIDITFFYVPQIVQALRYDVLGYVERFIVEAGKFSQLFAHQILWNMQANAYKDDDATIPDGMKPTLDKVTDSLIASFSGADKDFYEREFLFFSEVTGISGKLKPFIKSPKPEKKAKIEEELRKIKVEVGVYLPSNPDGVVVGIDRKSGKPLQSHAKAPYMATFRIKKQRGQDTDDQAQQMARPERRPKHKRITSTATVTTTASQDMNSYEVWQSAIFKVGDDCRQDVLALQLISAFRGIFNSVGLDVYVYPYRVTATAPGCGVIDVLPNSISRDMLGRESVNGLHDYFITKYGGEHSVRYQEARTEFVKSMAAYSVISYLLQFKDRHNGNIMVDDKGHILHIDFGFLFDISPGGVRFERAPFKLTPEMLAVMGGSDPNTSQAYRWFEELTVKAFLCSRQYCGKLLHLVSLMLDSGLPCFKPDTMRNLRARFVLDKSEKDAAEYMVALIRRSAANFSTKVYDEFQLLTNGIPY